MKKTATFPTVKKVQSDTPDAGVLLPATQCRCVCKSPKSNNPRQRNVIMMTLILHPAYELYEKKHVPFCSSLQVAEAFEKRHDHVLRDIALIGVPKFGEATESSNAFHAGNGIYG